MYVCKGKGWVYPICVSSQAVSVQSSDRQTQMQEVASSVFASTRYCFTLKLYCGSLSSVYPPPPPATPTLLQY